MANPNINSATNVYAANTSHSLTTTAATQIISNPASSGKVFLVDGVVVANTDTTSAVVVTLSQYTQATNTGTEFQIASKVSVPAASTLLVVDKQTGVNLLENQSLYVFAGATGALKVNAYWKEIS